MGFGKARFVTDYYFARLVHAPLGRHHAGGKLSGIDYTSRKLVCAAILETRNTSKHCSSVNP
jgi:hypothetical protein